jgi:hypothetical protein
VAARWQTRAPEMCDLERVTERTVILGAARARPASDGKTAAVFIQVFKSGSLLSGALERHRRDVPFG